ncbi:hypothetical protein EV424DRAFT_1356581, partial [Suillus variegatus]
MSERRVRVATPVSSEAGDSLPPDAGDIWTSIMFSSNPTQDHGVVSNDVVSNDSPVEPRPALPEDPIDWWGNYEYRVDSLGKREKNYERCFNGDFDEVTSMLSVAPHTQLFDSPAFPINGGRWRVTGRPNIGRRLYKTG